MNNRKHKYNPLYKNFLKLKVNPLNNNKFLKFELKHIVIKNQQTKQKKKQHLQRWELIKKSKKKKWSDFLNNQIRSKSFFNRFKPYTIYSYKSNKFASQGNALKKKFKNNLIAKITFSYLYGGLSKKYLKLNISQMYKSKKSKNTVNICTEFFESRLDSVLYKSNFCTSVKNAQQLITHKHVQVNSVIEKNKAYILKEGDLITFNSKSFKQIQTNFKMLFNNCPDSIIWPLPPNYLNINYKTLEITMGNINNFNFANLFSFKHNIHSIIVSNSRK